MDTETVVGKYFDSWPRQDWQRMRECLADRLEFNGVEHDADAFAVACADGVAWKNVTLIESVIGSDRAALLYDGVDKDSGTRMRVGEFLTIAEGKIRSIRAAIMVLD